MSDDDFDPPSEAIKIVNGLKAMGRKADADMAIAKRWKPRQSLKELPNSPEAERNLISCCFIDGDETVRRCKEAGIGPVSFYSENNGIIFARILDLYNRHKPTEISVVAEELRSLNQLDQVGGIPYLMQVSDGVATSASASFFIQKVAELAARRHLIREALSVAEEAREASEGMIDDLIESAKKRLATITITTPGNVGRSPSSFAVPPDGDPSILLGNRFLNRGDGGILVSTSGMGKSSLSIQGAYVWALGRDFFGIKPNGPLKSLIVQSEDSEGDVAEAIASMNHGLKLTDEDRATLDQNIVFVTERVRRGPRLIEELRRLVKLHKPDLVWLNPLVAFMDGDLTAAKDVGAFLREGLNSLNEPASFGYIIVHHTTKPPTDKGKSEVTWNEQMYQMGGSYDIPGWARFVVNLKATETEGQFNLVLSKRGSRAGVTRQVPQGTGFREEAVTSIPVKWAKGSIEIPGRKKKMPLVFWEPREMAVAAVEERSKPDNNQVITTYIPIIPKGEKLAETSAQLYRKADGVRKITQGALQDLLIEAARDGFVGTVRDAAGIPKYYLP